MESQGPSTNLVMVKVTDSGKPSLSVTNSFQVIVREVNQPPVLPELGQLEVDALKSWKWNLGGKDEDLPAQVLTYRLVRGPQGLAMSAQGAIQWTASLAQRGLHELEVSLGDGVTSVSRIYSLKVQVLNTAPVIEPRATCSVSL